MKWFEKQRQKVYLIVVSHLCDWEYISRIQTEKDGAVGVLSSRATGAAVQNVMIETGKTSTWFVLEMYTPTVRAAVVNSKSDGGGDGFSLHSRRSCVSNSHRYTRTVPGTLRWAAELKAVRLHRQDAQRC